MSESDPSPRLLHLVVPDDRHGSRLQDFLEGHWAQVDRVFLRNLVLEGAVSVNAGDGAPHSRLRAGDVVSVRVEGPMPEFRPHGRPLPGVRILHEDGRLLVVDKPAGVRAAPDRGGRDPGVLGRLWEQYGDEELRLVYRLAADTSGCLVVARSRALAEAVEAEFVAGEIEVEYLALVSGRVRFEQRVVARHLGPDPRRPGRIRVVEADSRGAREATTEVCVVERFRGHTLVRVLPRSLRSHQVRVHLQSLGHPVVADREYADRPELFLSAIKPDYKARRGVAERPLLSRMFLHVARVSLPGHDVRADLPADLARVLDKQRAFAALGGD